MKKILFLHGVNHNMFGKRDPKQYGKITLDQINDEVRKTAQELGGIEVEFFQSNSEGEMVDRIHKAYLDRVDAVCFNAGAWTHYSWSIHDALGMLECPIYELHMSNVHKREEWRHFSVLSPLAQGILVGLGSDVYTLALRAACSFLDKDK